MGVGSVVLGVVSLLMMFGGIVLAWLPGVGSILSFGAPVVALIGAVLGGIAMSRAKQEGESGGAATAGLILSIISFVFGLVFALTCGLCNACFSAAVIAGPRNRGDGGVYSWTRGGGRPPPWMIGPDGGVSADPDVDPDLDPGLDLDDDSGVPGSGSPPPAFPPPPLFPSGPRPTSVVPPSAPSGPVPAVSPPTSAPAESGIVPAQSVAPTEQAPPRRRRPLPPR